MNEAVLIAVISGAVSVVTIFGVKVWDGVIKKQEERSKMHGKEFDDGVERRKELIREIDRLNTVIAAKDEHILRMQEALDKARDTIAEWAIRYTKLEGQYLNAMEDLQKITGAVSEVKHKVINQNAAQQATVEAALMEKHENPSTG